jgi:signal transduction histidine kinase
MKVGRQLTVMMLAYLAPIGVAYTLVTGHIEDRIFSRDLKAEARIAQRALNASLTPDAEQGKWDEVRYTMSAIGREDLVVALLDESGRLRLAPRGFPIVIPALKLVSARMKSGGAFEFERRSDGHSWFCRIEPLGTGSYGYLLLAEDWTMLRGDRYRQIAAALLANIGFLLVGTIGISLLAHRYVARPLAQLHRRIMILDGSDPSERALEGGKVELISDEFRRINEQLTETRGRLLQGSERKLQLERRKLNADKLAAIATLASGFAHEIGTPLGVIRGRAEMLLSSTFEQSEVTENLEVIITQVDHITRMVKILLDNGRRRAAIRVASDVSAIADRTIKLLEPEAVRRGVEVFANLSSRPLMVDCDPDQLQQVFLNLGVNALDAMASRGGTLRVNSVADEVDGKIRLSFEDTGPGVPAALRDRIFDPFFTTKGPGQGEGMGLAVSQSVISDHDGELTLQQRTQGACFVVTLPASRPPELAPRT